MARPKRPLVVGVDTSNIRPQVRRDDLAFARSRPARKEAVTTGVLNRNALLQDCRKKDDKKMLSWALYVYGLSVSHLPNDTLTSVELVEPVKLVRVFRFADLKVQIDDA